VLYLSGLRRCWLGLKNYLVQAGKRVDIVSGHKYIWMELGDIAGHSAGTCAIVTPPDRDPARSYRTVTGTDPTTTILESYRVVDYWFCVAVIGGN